MVEEFDAFISYNNNERSLVIDVCGELRRRGIRVWLDEWQLRPGSSWQDGIENIITNTNAAVVFVGESGIAPWQDAAMRACLSEFVERRLQVIPVLLPGVSEEMELPLFLGQHSWVDLREGISVEGLDRLQYGITGEAVSFKSVIKKRTYNINDAMSIIEVLIANGKDINEEYPDDEYPDEYTPLFVAVKYNKRDIVVLLLGQNNIDINKRNRYGWTALHLAANAGYIDIVNLLLMHREIDPTITTNSGATAAYEAAFGSDEIGIIILLRNAGIDIFQNSTFDYFTPLMVAIWRENFRVAEFLIEEASIEHLNATDSNRETAFFKAVKQGNYDLVTQLLQREVDPYRRPTNRASQGREIDLYEAAEKGYFDTVKRLIAERKSKGSINEWINTSLPPYSRTALSIAAERGHYEIVKELVESGADIFARNNHGRTPREMTLRRNRHIISYLEEAESDRNKRSI